MILVTGATGHLGAHVAIGLRRAKRPVRLLIRNEEKLRRLGEHAPCLVGVESIIGDIRDEELLVDALRGVRQIVHCCHSHEYWRGASYLSSVNVGGTDALVRAVKRRPDVDELVFVGSYSAHNFEVQTEDGHLALVSARECSSRAKRLAQQHLLDAAADGAFRLHIVSPSYMIGPLHMDPTYFGALFHAVLLKPLRWCPPNGINLVDVRDVARAVIWCIGRTGSGERVLASGDNVLTARLFALMNREAGFQITPRTIPPILFRLAPPLRQFGRFGRKYFTKDHFVYESGLFPRELSLEDSVRDTISWARHSPLFASQLAFHWWIFKRYLP